jgi:glycosyltransferase involved in cell wall biosynthesis
VAAQETSVKILMVDKYFFIMGGAERYYFELKNILEQHGHQVIPFSMQHPRNFPSAWSDYFVSNIEFNGHSKLQQLAQSPKIVSRVLYSQEAKAAITKLIERVKPDIAHLHMIDHQLSPSILHALQRYDIPVVQTCHQYKLVCPSYRLLVMRENRICEKCVTGNFYHAVLERCHKDSVAASALIAFESYLHKWLRVYDLIRLFHVPSRFLGRKFRDSGVSDKRIWQQFYTIDLRHYPFSEVFEDYFVYYGRLSGEKGILTLLRAMQEVNKSKLLIIGDGPQRAELENFATAHKLSNVVFTGSKSGKELTQLVSRAKFVVVPSEWYDNSPLVIYESFAMGRPVIATNLGGMPELIEDGVNGRLFAPKDADGLSRIINEMLNDEKVLRQMGQAGRATAEREFAPEVHYQKIYEVYQRLIS